MPAHAFRSLTAVPTFQHYSDKLQGWSPRIGGLQLGTRHVPNIMRLSSNRKDLLACDSNVDMSLS